MGRQGPNTVGHRDPDTVGQQQHPGAIDESLEQGSRPGKTQKRKVYIPGGEDLTHNRVEPEK